MEREPGASGCPDAAMVSARTRDANGASNSERDIIVSFRHSSVGYESTVVTSDGKRRTLSDGSASCEPLAEATFLAVRLALDVPVEPAPAPEPESKPAIVATAEPTRDRVETPAAPRFERRDVGAEVLAGGLVAVGIGSPFAPGFRGGAALTFGDGRWSLGATGAFLASQSRDVGKGQVDVSVAGGGLEFCGRARVRPVRLGLCARLEAFRLNAASRGFVRTDEQARPLFTGTILARGQVAVAGPVGLYAEVGAVAPLIRERFAIDGVGLVYDPPLLAGSGGLGVIVDFE